MPVAVSFSGVLLVLTGTWCSHIKVWRESDCKLNLDLSDKITQDHWWVFHNACSLLQASRWGCGSPVVRVSDHGRYVMSSSPVPLKTRRVGQRSALNLSRAQTSSRWCGVVVRRGGARSGVVHVT
ncbi:uncharacterized protein TNCV_4167721 [Trichonephila clavipes]|nr:uncharacterized protein TNCV_4167721 [Trichonephila clavipes]